MTRFLRILILTICFAIVGFVACGFGLAYFVERHYARHALKNASVAELEEAVGSLGGVMHFPDGSWMAIRYNDSHALVPWSLATALDSGGRWYQSTEHFCGTLRLIRMIQNPERVVNERGEQIGTFPETDVPIPRKPGEKIDRADWVFLMMRAPDLATARKRMYQYFRSAD